MVAKIKDVSEFRLEIAKKGYSDSELSRQLGRYRTFIHTVIYKKQTSITSAYLISKKLKVPFEKHFDLVPR